MKSITWIVILLVVLVGGYFLLQKTPGESMMESTMGSYAYVCDNGSGFSMTPSEDVASLQITADAQGMFTGEAMLMHMGDGPYFEGEHMGTLIVFRGAGEEVELSVGNETTTCNPVPNTEMAPWNWGDPGEGAGSMQPDVRLVVGESIMGKWQSVDDAKFVREFKDFAEGSMSGTVVDWYEGKEVSSGTYLVFTSEHPAEVSFTLMESKPYIQMTMQGTQADTLNFSLEKLTPEELELIYMDRGGVLRFKSIQ